MDKRPLTVTCSVQHVNVIKFAGIATTILMAIYFSCLPDNPVNPGNTDPKYKKSGEWKKTDGPGGRSVREISANEGNVFLISDDDLFVLDTVTNTWNERFTNSYGYYTIRFVNKKIFAGTSTGVLISKDNGYTWATKRGTSSSGIQFISGHGSFMLAYGGGTLWSSVDSGETWKTRFSGSGSYSGNVILVMDKVAMFTEKGSVDRSDDNLATYTAHNLTNDTAEVVSLLESEGTVYAFSTTEVSVSQDTGKTWTRLGDVPQVPLKFNYAANSELLLIGTVGGLLISRDRATTWQKADLPFDSVSINTICLRKNEIFIGGEDGVFISKDKGLTWSAYNRGLDVDVYHLVIADSNLIAGTWGSGIWINKKMNSSWARARDVPMYVMVFGMFVNKDNILAGNWQSVDNGLTWTYKGTYSINAYCSNAEFLFAATEQDGVVKSIDQGKTWVSTSFTERYLKHIQCIKNRIIVTSSYNVLYSDDNGNTWIDSEKEPSSPIEAWGQRNDTIFAVTDSGLYISKDFGVTWSVNSPPFPNTATFSSMDCTEKDIFVTSYYSGTVYRYDIRNRIWENIGPERDKYYVKCIAHAQNRLFIGTNKGVMQLDL
jgi:photosystem II stability/assembly factor-like uncharacterized protein